MPVHPPAILAHIYVIVAGPNAEEFDPIPDKIKGVLMSHFVQHTI